MIPNRAGRDSLAFTMEMRTCESDRTVRERMLDEAAIITAERIAMASATRADVMNRREKLMFSGRLVREVLLWS